MMLPDESNGSEQPCSSDHGQLLNLRKMLAEEVERKLNIFRREMQLMVPKYFHEEIKPAIIEGLLRKVIKEEIQKHVPGRTWNEAPEERILHLKFLDELSGTVQTRKEFKGIKDSPLEVALFDGIGDRVTTGPESSAEVEIVLIDASGDDKEKNMTNETFERRIIRAGNKEKPHFAKNEYVKLDKGVGNLTNLMLGQNSGWTKIWTCRLGARLVKNFRGLKVQNAWTAPFKVVDNRSKLYEKHETPILSSEVWRLNEVSRHGEPYQRLKDEEIMTVRDFLFWFSVDPEGLKKILGARDGRWKTIVDHAQTCKIDDKKLYRHKPSTEPQMGIIYDCVGKLKGVIDESHFFPVDDLSADKKDHARKLLSSLLKPSAFEERYKPFSDDEASLLQQYPYKSSRINVSTSCSTQQCLNSNDSEYINSYQEAEPGCSSQSIRMDMGEPSDRALGPTLDPENNDGYIPCLDSEIQTSRPSGMEADPGVLVPTNENANPPNDMNPLNTDAYPWNDTELLQFHFSPFRMHEYECTHISDDQGAVVNASKRWMQLYYVLTWRFSITRRLSLNVTHPQRKKQRVG